MSRHRVHSVALLSVGLLFSVASLAAAVETDSLRDELARIFGPEKHYEPEAFGPARWLLDGEAYTTLESSESVPDAKDIVRYESGSAKREVLVDAKSLACLQGKRNLSKSRITSFSTPGCSSRPGSIRPGVTL